MNLSKKTPSLHRTSLKEYDNKSSSGFYSGSEQRISIEKVKGLK